MEVDFHHYKYISEKGHAPLYQNNRPFPNEGVAIFSQHHGIMGFQHVVTISEISKTITKGGGFKYLLCSPLFG